MYTHAHTNAKISSISSTLYTIICFFPIQSYHNTAQIKFNRLIKNLPNKLRHFEENFEGNYGAFVSICLCHWSTCKLFDQKSLSQEKHKSSERAVLFWGSLCLLLHISDFKHTQSTANGIIWYKSCLPQELFKSFNQKICSLSLCPETIHSHSTLSLDQSMLGHQ